MLGLALVAMSIALLLTIASKNKTIKGLTDERDQARKLGLVNKSACVIALNQASNGEEVREYFLSLIRKGLLIAKTPGGFEDTGLSDDEAVMRIYCWQEILKEWEEQGQP
jgi:hypothetical protein